MAPQDPINLCFPLFYLAAGSFSSFVRDNYEMKIFILYSSHTFSKLNPFLNEMEKWNGLFALTGPLKHTLFMNKVKLLLLINHILIIAKQYLYSCRQNKSLPSIKVLNLKIKTIHQLETMIAKSNNKLKAHNMKWDKYKNY